MKVRIHVDAPPERVWELVADVSRMGEWSPICYRCEWLGPERGEGARFKGYNRLGPARWTRECIVSEAERGRVFAFSTYYRGRESTRWRYTFEPADGGTDVTESYEPVFVPPYVRASRLLPGQRHRSERDSRRGMEETLRRVKAAAESARPA